MICTAFAASEHDAALEWCHGMRLRYTVVYITLIVAVNYGFTVTVSSHAR